MLEGVGRLGGNGGLGCVGASARGRRLFLLRLLFLQGGGGGGGRGGGRARAVVAMDEDAKGSGMARAVVAIDEDAETDAGMYITGTGGS